jgi:peptidoglycan/xylan/chitin deacetylase (PgdA/CDA1 family)
MLLKNLGRRLFHWSGGVHAVRYRHRRALRILMYHRFGSPDAQAQRRLNDQLAHLKRWYSVMPLTEAILKLEAATLPSNALVITVDDGRRDFYTTAFPVFRRFGFSATLFLTTNYLDRQGWLWFDEVDHMFGQTQRQSFELETMRLSLATLAQRAAAAETVKQSVLQIPNGERIRLLENLRAQLDVNVPKHPPEPLDALHWDDVREMARHGIEFGAHTRTHPILARLESSEEMFAEIDGSKRRIEEELQCEAIHFCYPNGMAADMTDAAVECVRRAGFKTAVMAEPGVNRPGASLFHLRRIPADSDANADYYERSCAGFRIG